MKHLFYAGLFLSSMALAQSISLDEKQPIEQPQQKKPLSHSLSYVEFRDAKISNVLKLIQAQSGLSCSNKESQTDLSLKLEDVSWSELLKIVCNQATP